MELFSNLDELRVIPIEIYKDLINSYIPASYTSSDFKPFSTENLKKTKEILQNLKKTQISQLERLSKFFEVQEVWWDVFKVKSGKISIINHLKSNKEKANNYYVLKGKETSDYYHIMDIAEFYFVTLECRSRSPSLRGEFRFIISKESDYFFLEKKKFVKDKFIEFTEYLSVNLDYAQERIKALLIRRIVKEGHVLTNLKVKLTLETTGIEGLSLISIEGENVLRGLETLKDRQEKSLDFVVSGPWIGAGTKDFHLEVAKGLKLSSVSLTTLQAISKIVYPKK